MTSDQPPHSPETFPPLITRIKHMLVPRHRQNDLEPTPETPPNSYTIFKTFDNTPNSQLFIGLSPRGRLVILKTLNGHGFDPTSLTHHEAIHTARFEHPGIIPVIDFQTVDLPHQHRSVPAIVLPYLDPTEYRPLYSLTIHQDLSPESLANIILGLGATLEFIHSRKQLHLDVKPGNIMVNTHSSSLPLPLLIDFGTSSLADLTNSNLIIGTPGYSPPEVFADQPYTKSGEIFALAVTAFTALTGELPHQTINTNHHLIYTHQLDLLTHFPAVVDAIQKNHGGPHRLNMLFASALNEDPQLRPTSAMKFATEFASCLGYPDMAPPYRYNSPQS